MTSLTCITRLHIWKCYANILENNFHQPDQLYACSVKVNLLLKIFWLSGLFFERRCVMRLNGKFFTKEFSEQHRAKGSPNVSSQYLMVKFVFQNICIIFLQVVHVNDFVYQFTYQWRHLTDRQIRLKGKNICANHQNKYEQWRCIQGYNYLLKSHTGATCSNYRHLLFRYECSWPAHCITLTPEQGAILPRSSVLICVSANCAIRSKGTALPWKGNIIVYCDGGEKVKHSFC